LFFEIQGFYNSSTTSVTSSSQILHPSNDVQQSRDDQDEVLGRMDEDNDLPIDILNPTVNKMDDDNSDSPLALEELTTKQDNDDDDDGESTASLLTRVTSAPTMPIAISRNINIPAKNDTKISYSVMETSSLGRGGTAENLRCC
jgi:hypothetical protein